MTIVMVILRFLSFTPPQTDTLSASDTTHPVSVRSRLRCLDGSGRPGTPVPRDKSRYVFVGR